MAASDQWHEGGGLHSLGSFINDHNVKGPRHARKQARPRERQRAAHNVGLLQDGQLYAVARSRTGRLPALQHNNTRRSEYTLPSQWMGVPVGRGLWVPLAVGSGWVEIPIAGKHGIH